MKWKEYLIKFINEVYISLRHSLKDITIFPGTNLYPSLLFAIVIFVVSVLTRLIGSYNFINPIGAGVGTLILGIIYYVGERREHAEVGNVSGNGNNIGVVGEWEQGSSEEG